MAGGLGKRMYSNIPKVLHKIKNKPMIVKIIETSLKLNPDKILIVVGKYKDIIKEEISKYLKLDNIQFIDQIVPRGTGDAIMSCRSFLQDYKNKSVLILSGDVPLVSIDTLKNTLDNLNKVKIVTSQVDNPFGLGRIKIENNSFVEIIEEKDCNNEEKKINIINSGIYAFNSEILCKYLPYIENNNKQNEYYLTDIIKIIKDNEKINIDMLVIEKDRHYEILGVNTQEQLDYLNTIV
tara:strand:- start:97 stop:807 length:711 start_codon:yes stop_codon:yes gene_type:complete